MTPEYPNRPETSAPPACPRAAGFTLIELMITVVIATILLSIAIPLYLHQIRESRRTDARSTLMDLAGREERYYATNSNYTSSASDLGYGSASWPVTIGSGYYEIDQPNVPTTGTPSFSIKAVPVAGKGQDQDTTCASFTIDSTGKQSALDTSNNDQTSTCWGQ